MDKTTHIRRLLLLPLLLLLLQDEAQAQAPLNPAPHCTKNQSIYPCKAFLYYQATAPDLLDLAAIGDLFGLSRLMIAKPNNISSLSSPLPASQPLLIPVTCSCNGNTSSYNITYAFVRGDTMYGLSVGKLQNLTTWPVTETFNPSVIATKIEIGDEVVFPLFCKCPNSTNTTQQNHVITYFFQPSDTLSSVAAKFGADARSISSFNGAAAIRPFSVIYVPVTKLPRLQKITPVSASPAPSPSTITVVASSRSDRKRLVVALIVVAAVLGALVFVLGAVAAWLSAGLMRRGREEEAAAAIAYGQKGAVAEERKDGKRLGWVGDKFMEDVWECMDKYKLYNVEEVREATKNFDESCLIQGSVYKGRMREEMFAIKRMNWNAYEELKILQKVNHANLVKLDGFCIDPDNGSCYLVYEYVENGSLYSWLHPGNKAKKLDWKSRLQIAADVASGLQYIHEHATPSVVHKDIKSTNVLLDTKMRAKIANFGLARSGCNVITMHIVGTQGYLAPEYLADGLITTRMDVFAFGVVLLELVSGLQPIDEEGKVLWMSLEKICREGRVEEEMLKTWMDEAILEQSFSMDSVMNVMAVAIGCLQRDPSKRPSMVDVVYMLSHAGECYLNEPDSVVSNSY